MGWIFGLLGLTAMAAGGGAIALGWPLVPLERGWTLVISGSSLAAGGLICFAVAGLMLEMRRTRLALLKALAAAKPEPAGPPAGSSFAVPTQLATHAGAELSAARPPTPAPRIEPAPAKPDAQSSRAASTPAPSSPLVASLRPQRVEPPAPLGAASETTPRHEDDAAPSEKEGVAAKEQEPDAASALPDAEPADREKKAGLPSSATRGDGSETTDPGESEASPGEGSRPARSFSVGDTTFIVFTDGSIEARTPNGTQRFDSMEEVRNYVRQSTSEGSSKSA